MGEVIPEGAKCREQNKQLKRMTGLRVSGSSKLKESGLRRCPHPQRNTEVLLGLLPSVVPVGVPPRAPV